MAVKYTYSIIDDFPNSKVSLSRLTREINSYDMTSSLSHINTNDDDCDIWFVESLSSIDTTSLNAIVSIHSGEAIPPLISEYDVTAGEDIGDKKAVYLSGSDEVKLACAGSESTIPCVGFTGSSGLQGETVAVFTNDVLSGFSGLTPGAEYFLSQDSTSAGEIQLQKPSSGIIISVGIAKNLTELDVHIFKQAPAESISGISFTMSDHAFHDYVGIGKITYTNVRSFIFDGTDIWTPQKFSITASLSKPGATGYARLYDYTNNNIISVITWTNQYKEMITSSSLSNLPAGKALIELQVLTNIKGTDAKLYYMSLY